ncbi:MAG: hypothetical protein IPK19_02315 [Chloroflexi bacterium]|nr:hypothetical protein [Chloroflexota bacterium]
MLMALDGLGYNAASVSGFLSEAARQKVEQMGAIVRLALHTVNQPVNHDGLRIGLVPGEATTLDAEDWLRLAAVTHGEVGVAHLDREGGAWRLASSGIYRLPPGQLPDPTIAGMVEFILAEADYARKRRDQRE